MPKVAPFLDPMITWDGVTVDVSHGGGQGQVRQPIYPLVQPILLRQHGRLCGHLPGAIDGRVVLDTWHVKFNLTNLASLTRSDVESRLAAAFAASHPVFNNGIRHGHDGVERSHVRLRGRESAPVRDHRHYSRTSNGELRSVQLKGGYWDQNIRNPGRFLREEGVGLQQRLERGEPRTRPEPGLYRELERIRRGLRHLRGRPRPALHPARQRQHQHRYLVAHQRP